MANSDTCQCPRPDVTIAETSVFCAWCGGDINPERAALILYENAQPPAIDAEAGATAAGYGPFGPM
jgi:hypothetical protein